MQNATFGEHTPLIVRPQGIIYPSLPPLPLKYPTSASRVYCEEFILCCFNLFELATGKFPYPKWKSVFDQLSQVVKGDPPRLTNEDGRNFSDEMLAFTNVW